MLYTSIVAERIGLRRSFAVIMAMSFALNFILALALLLQQPETRTIVVPPTLAAEREVWTFDEAGPGAPYLERWALSVLSHAASVTPETVDSSRRVVLQHVDPGFYGKLEEALIVEADRIKKDHSSTIFYPDRARVNTSDLSVEVEGVQKTLVGSTVTSMFELPTLNSLDAIDRQQVHYATIQLNGPRFPIDTADYFNLVIHRALHEAGLTVEMLCQELRLDMSAVEDMLQSKVFCPDELALITFHLRLDTAFMMEAHAALTLPSCSKPSTVVAEPADTLKECVVKHGYKTLNHFSEVHGFDPIAMNTISLHRRCTDSTGMKLAKALNVSLEEIRTVLVASDFDPVPKSLKLLIKKRNYTTYKEFAAAAGLTEHHIMKIAKTRTCTTTCAVKLCKALGITEDELAASLLIAEPRHKHGSKLETPSKESMEEVASTKARRKKDESDTEEECGTSTVSLKRPRRSSK